MNETSKNNTWLWIGVVVVVIVGLLLAWKLYYGAGQIPSESTAQEESDDVAGLAAELEAVELDGLDAELNDIDEELAQ